MLSNVDIEKAIDWGNLAADGASVEPASIDLHLGNTFEQFDEYGYLVDVADEDTYPATETYISDTFTIAPNGFVLAHTDEYVEMPNDMSGILHGRSSLGRLGLFVENAGFVDPSFEGTLTLELFNCSPNPIKLHSGMKIVQMVLFETNTEPSVEYGSVNGNKYSGQSEPTTSELWRDFSDE